MSEEKWVMQRYVRYVKEKEKSAIKKQGGRRPAMDVMEEDG